MTQKYHEIFRISSRVQIHGVIWFNMASWRFLPDGWKMYFSNVQTFSLNCTMWQILLQHVQHGLLGRCLILDSGSFVPVHPAQVQYLLQRQWKTSHRFFASGGYRRCHEDVFFPTSPNPKPQTRLQTPSWTKVSQHWKKQTLFLWREVSRRIPIQATSF